MSNLLETVDTDLMNKYDIYVFDYIEYPHKSFWSLKKNEDYKGALRDFFSLEDSPPLVLYVHIPFCEQMCWFCLCHLKITHDYERVKSYMKFLYRELDLLHKFFEENSILPSFKEIHLGGGSPTYLGEPEFIDLKEKLQSIVDFKNLAEFAIEIDPRRVDRDRMKFYRAQGINRISFGVQDFDLEVQKAVNRVQPLELLENLLTTEIRKSFDSINFDLLCGLPKQNRETIRRTIQKVIELSPDRIALSFMHYFPNHAPHQKLMKKDGELPDFRERKLIFHEAIQGLVDSGYVRTGFEHFAKPTDAVAQAVQDKTVQYNSLGATPGRCSYLIGLGEHSYSRVGPYYFQNVYEQSAYEAAVLKGEFPIYRGHQLSEDDVIRRDIIHKLRSLFELDCREIEQKYNIDFEDYFEEEKWVLEEFAKDGMLNLPDNTITITEIGKYFSNLVCRIFDRYSRGARHPYDFFEAPKIVL